MLFKLSKKHHFIKWSILTLAFILFVLGISTGFFHACIEVTQALLPQSPHSLSSEEENKILSSAHTEDVNNLTVLYLTGTPYQMGYQHGHFARNKILSFRHAAYDYMTNLIGQEMSLPHWMSSLLTKPLLFWQALKYRDKIPQIYLEEATGIADGAGIHQLEVILVTAIWEMYLVGGCSEFAVTGEMTSDGELIHGYNYDLMAKEHALINPHLAMIFYRPSSGIPFSTMNTVGSIGVNAGMNDKGISVAWDNTYVRDRTIFKGIDFPVIPFIITLRRVLQESASLDEGIVKVIKTLPRPLADIVIISSAKEHQAVALETAGKVYATRPLKNGAVWSTNYFRSTELAPYEIRGDWREMSDSQSVRTFPRYASYSELLNRFKGCITPRIALEILRDPYPREAVGEKYPEKRTTICRPYTGFSLIMKPGQGLIWCSDGQLPAPQGKFYAFDQKQWERLPELDFSESGFRSAVECANAYLQGNFPAAQGALQKAIKLDGKTTPYLLMESILLFKVNEKNNAQSILKQIFTKWPDTEIGRLAYAWLKGEKQNPISVPFPSAISPILTISERSIEN